MSGSIELSGEEYSELVAKLAAVELENAELQGHLQHAISLGKGMRDAELGKVTSLQCVRGEHDDCPTDRANFRCKCECHVRRLVEAARAYLEKQTAARQLELAAALKPF